MVKFSDNMEEVFESELYLEFIRMLGHSGMKAHVTVIKDGQCHKRTDDVILRILDQF